MPYPSQRTVGVFIQYSWLHVVWQAVLQWLRGAALPAGMVGAAAAMVSLLWGLRWMKQRWRRRQQQRRYEPPADSDSEGLVRQQRMVVVFDFDRTITAEHTAGHHQQTDEEVAANIADPLFFKGFCERVAVAGHQLAIASFSSEKALVMQYLSIALGGDMQRTLLFPDAHLACWAQGPHDDIGKSSHLASIVTTIGGCAPREIILIDDDPSNVAAAAAAGHWAFCCAEVGFTRGFYDTVPLLEELLFPVERSEIHTHRTA